jgi:hypothetical protein
MRRIPKYNSEHSLYEQIARYLQQQYPDVIYRFDIAADLKLTPGQAAKHKKLHQERGYPNLLIAESSTNVWNNPVREWGLYFGLYIEIKKDGTKLKRDKDAKKILKGDTKIRKKGDWFDKHIEEQAEMLEKLRERGYRAEFGVGFDECKQIIDEYLRSAR